MLFATPASASELHSLVAFMSCTGFQAHIFIGAGMLLVTPVSASEQQLTLGMRLVVCPWDCVFLAPAEDKYLLL
jgi:hypothetical protein